MNPKYITRITRRTITPPTDPLFSEMITHVEIDDEAAGEFVKIRQQAGHTDVEGQTISVTDDDWPLIRQAVEDTFVTIHHHERRIEAEMKEKP